MSELPPAGDTPAHAAETSAPPLASETPRKITTKALAKLLRVGAKVKFGGESGVEISPKTLGEGLVNAIGVVPVKTTPFLNRNPKFLIIPKNGKFLYYKAGPLHLLSPAKGGVYSLAKNPQVLHEGIMILPDEQKTAVWVTVDDLRKNEFTAYRALPLKRGKISYDDIVNGTFRRAPARAAADRAPSAPSSDPGPEDLAGSFDGLTAEELEIALRDPLEEELGVPGSLDPEA